MGDRVLDWVEEAKTKYRGHFTALLTKA